MADDGQTFPAGDAATELNRYKPDQFPSDSVSSANNDKEATKSRAGAGAGAGGKCCLGSGLKSALVISSVVVAAVVVAFFVTKKQKQT